jgi:hypothetical protein
MSEAVADVVVVPVAIRQADPPTLVALQGPGGGWACQPLVGTAQGTAQRLLTGVLPPGTDILELSRQRARPATFVEGEAGNPRLTLLFTLALPMALADDAAPEHDRWTPLVHPRSTATAARVIGGDLLANVPFAHAIVDYWRQSLEETAAALLFVSRYWTLPQLRDVYSAIWGYEQDTASFTSWALGRGGALSDVVAKLEDTDVTDELAAALADAAEAMDADAADRTHAARAAMRSAASMAAWTALTRSMRSPKAVGLRALGSAATFGIPAAAVVAAAGAVAYQSSARGRAPKWYRTAVEHPIEHKLKRTYAPRPAWLDQAG